MDRRGVHDVPVFDECQLGGAAADVDVQDRSPQVVRELCRARAVGGEQRLHVVSRRGAHELPAHLGDHLGDRLGVLAPQRLSGKDHGTRVDLVGMDVGLGVSAVDDLAHRALVDARLALVGRQHHRRLVQRLALHHEVAAGELFGEPAHVDAREDHLRAGRADVDAHRDQRDVVLLPERVVLDVVLADVVVIVVVVELALGVRVRGLRPLEVIEERVLLRPEGLGHQILKLSSVSGAKSSSGVRRRAESPCSW